MPSSDEPGPVPQADTSKSGKRFISRLPIAGTLAVMIIDSAYLAISNRASGPPRIPVSALIFEGSLLLHLGLGILGIAYLLAEERLLGASVRRQTGSAKTLARITLMCLRFVMLTGICFLGIGFRWLPMGIRMPLRTVHDLATIGFLVSGLAFIILKARTSLPEAVADRARARFVLKLSGVVTVPFAALILYTIYAPNTDRVIVNPALPPLNAAYEGDGVTGKFYPASVQSVDNQFFPSKYFMDSKTCGEKGCHPDIYKQWESSAHRRGSFNNQWYRNSIEYMQEVIGTKPSKWCGGCHDMAVLLTEDPHNPGKSRFDSPIMAHDFPVDKYPESHSGIGCAACHSIVHVKSTMGVNDYTLDYPPMHKYIITANPVARELQDFLTRVAPTPHKKTFLRPFHQEQTAKFCAACHKVHLDVAVNNYRWLRGFSEYDSWQQSGVSGFGAASFYYPSDDTGNPAFKKCTDCHMQGVKSGDAGAVNGLVHDHRFPAANTALPTAYHDKDMLAATTKFLQDKALSVDIFALRKPLGTVKQSHQPSSSGQQTQQQQDTPATASIVGDDTGTHIAAAQSTNQAEKLVAPINRGGPDAVLRRGESPLVDVVVRTLKVGHSFPGGTIDSADVWLELEAKDNTGATIYHSGKLQWPNGPEEPGAEQYRAVQIDEHGNMIDKRNAWAARALVYSKVIGPGSADAVHFRLNVPKSCGNQITLTAKLNFRKFAWHNNAFAYAGRTDDTVGATDDASKVKVGVGYDSEGHVKTTGPVSHGWDDRKFRFDADLSKVSGDIKAIPDLPITVLAQDTVTLPVVDGKAPGPLPVTVATDDTKKKDRVRWNDYGIGLMLQGDFLHATNAFEQVTKIAPAWPEGWVNIGRVRQVERDTPAARAAFEKAFTLYDAKPTPMTKYLRARTQNFYAQSLFDCGQIDAAVAVLLQAIEVFPDDRNMRNLAGIILFRVGKYDDSIKQLKYTLSIDPEDVIAHYNLMKCYRAKGDVAQADVHASLYKRFKADETTTHLVGPYVRTHPLDNNLAQPIHEHADAVILPKPQWLITLEAMQSKQAMTELHKSPAHPIAASGLHGATHNQ